MIASLLLVLGLATAADQLQALDDFSYVDAAAARAAWKSSSGTPPVEMIDAAGRRMLELRVPFAAQPNLERTIIDRQVQLDLAVPGEFLLEVALDPPTAAANINLYFQSGKGWYSATAPLKKKGWQTVRISKAAFRLEGTPTGWKQINTVRISVWRNQPHDAVLRLRSLAAVAHEVALVIPATTDGGEGRELKAALEAAARVGKFLEELGLGSDAVDEAAVAQGALGSRKVAILAYNLRLPAETIAGLEQFVQAGGKLIVCYQLPPRLAKLLGIKSVKWMRSEPGQFAQMRFADDQIVGLPPAARQSSWNISAPEPAAGGARIIGQWYNAQGESAGQAAMTAHPNGVFISHLLLPDDRDAKQQLVAALVGWLCPPLWKTMAASALDAAEAVGPFDRAEEVQAVVARSNNPAALQSAAEAKSAFAMTSALIARQQYPQAMAAARQAHEQLVDAYLRAQPSRPREGRAVWNHSGTGPYPGDWARAAKELSAGGFNMVLPNMLWGGLAHYDSKILPHSATFDKYGDQIAQCLAAAKQSGLEVHVWKVNWNLSTAPSSFVEQMRQQKRLIVSAAGKEDKWLCPSNPENQKLEREAMLEVVRNYAVDGVHFDYIRYPGGEFCFCDGCRGRFEAESGQPVAQWPQDCRTGSRRDAYNAWRCQQITRLVEAVSTEARRVRPNIKISAAVFGSYPDCTRSVAQDWVLWCHRGYLDFVCPMDYTEGNQTFSNLVENQLRLIAGKTPMYPGIGAVASHSTLSPDRVAAQVEIARRLGAAGFTIFDYQPSTAATVIPGMGLGVGSQSAVPPHRPASGKP